MSNGGVRLDQRVVFGARCSWWNHVSEAASLPSGLPCCPFCQSVLMEVESEERYLADLDENGKRFALWRKGVCFASYDSVRSVWMGQENLIRCLQAAVDALYDGDDEKATAAIELAADETGIEPSDPSYHREDML